MSLTSNLFFLFTILGLCIYYVVPKRLQWIVLLVCSYCYYMIVSIPAVFFLLFSTIVTYGCALWIKKVGTLANDERVAAKKKKRIVTIGILLDLGMLAFLKYSNFLISNINLMTNGHINLLHLILPLGISYYTFQTLGYLLDVYWGEQKQKRIWVNMPCLYPSFHSWFKVLLVDMENWPDN